MIRQMQSVLPGLFSQSFFNTLNPSLDFASCSKIQTKKLQNRTVKVGECSIQRNRFGSWS